MAESVENTSNIDWHSFDERSELFNVLTERVTQTLRGALANQQAASLMVSGGESPRPLYEALSQVNLPWHQITVFLADERWVDIDSSNSNQHLIETTLLQGRADTANFIGLKTATSYPDEATVIGDQLLSRIPAPFTLGLLGMGEDGHTASLFPCSKQLENALQLKSQLQSQLQSQLKSQPQLQRQGTQRNASTVSASQLTCKAITPKDAPFHRLTLTLPSLLNGGALILLILGERKKALLESISKRFASPEYPVSYIIHQTQTPVSVYWAP